MSSKSLRNTTITIFVIFWILLFHYESIRFFYLNPFFRRELPKFQFLFPPAGWIMFFNVGDSTAYVEVYGVKNNESFPLDPHDIFRTRTIGFDNIHRNILSSVGSLDQARPFCRYLRFRYPYFDKFVVTTIYYPSPTKEPYKRIQQAQYQCLAH